MMKATRLEFENSIPLNPSYSEHKTCYWNQNVTRMFINENFNSLKGHTIENYIYNICGIFNDIICCFLYFSSEKLKTSSIGTSFTSM
jgi:hypothetical protein